MVRGSGCLLECEAKPAVLSVHADAHGAAGDVIGADGLDKLLESVERSIADLKNGRHGLLVDAVEQEHEADALGTTPSLSTERAALSVPAGNAVVCPADEAFAFEALAHGQHVGDEALQLFTPPSSDPELVLVEAHEQRAVLVEQCVYHDCASGLIPKTVRAAC